MAKTDLIIRHRSDTLCLTARHDARKARLSGSIVRGEADAPTDIDTLVDLEPWTVNHPRTLRVLDLNLDPPQETSQLPGGFYPGPAQPFDIVWP